MSLNLLVQDGGYAGNGEPWFPDREEVELLLRISLFSPEDERALSKAWRILQGQTDDYLDVVLGVVAAYPPLAHALRNTEEDNGSDSDSETMRRYFQRWLSETCNRPKDPPWLRQLQSKPPTQEGPANRVSADALPQFRYLIALVYPLVATARPFLATGGHSTVEVEQMQYALLKAILLQVALLAKLYIETGDW